jgi:hypothetical protein
VPQTWVSNGVGTAALICGAIALIILCVVILRKKYGGKKA